VTHRRARQHQPGRQAAARFPQDRQARLLASATGTALALRWFVSHGRHRGGWLCLPWETSGSSAGPPRARR
jgi:hypothetical protein